MNKYILCTMDKSKTETEKDLKKNADAAAAAADAAAAAADAAYAAAADAADADYWLNRYFERTGENKKDYLKVIEELEK